MQNNIHLTTFYISVNDNLDNKITIRMYLKFNGMYLV